MEKNTFWSTKLQTIETLDFSREKRFRDDKKELFLKAFGLKKGSKILDIGCGPGTFTRKLAKWLGNRTIIYGLDRDSNFISYCQSQKMGKTNLHYLEGDALNLPFDNNSFDSCISTTVIEHLPNQDFLQEQYRVCKNGGNTAVAYFRPDKFIRTPQHPDLKKTTEEVFLWNKLVKDIPDYDKMYDVAKYWPQEHKLPLAFTKVGFNKIEMDSIAIVDAIDDNRNSKSQKLSLIKNAYRSELSNIKEITLETDSLNPKEITKLKRLIKERYSKRKSFVENNLAIWDLEISLMIIVKGFK